MSKGSGTYASRLKAYPAKGVCGLPETYDSSDTLSTKLNTLTTWWKAATNVCVLTGAGISTSAGISDFRGPQGVWTLELEREKQEHKSRKRKRSQQFGKRRRKKSTGSNSNSNSNSTTTLFPPAFNSTSSSTGSTPTPTVSSFQAARPTLTHRALTALVVHGKLNYVVTQNVDGLHQRAGLQRDKLAILHGCVFEEQCEDCRALYFRDKEVDSISFQPTGNTCIKCSGMCRDTLLDWEDALPEDQLCPSEEQCRRADLIVTLGTSLRIEPAGSLPLLCKETKHKGRVVIVNLQETPKDHASDLLIRARVDNVMAKIALELLGEGWDDGA
jgi:mono-ADP-ribosyltransferase sirtuin 6